MSYFFDKKTGYQLAVEKMLVAQPAAVGKAIADNIPMMPMLLGPLWREGEVAVVLGSSGSGKSLLAVQVADAVSRGVAVEGFGMEAGAQKVLFFDMEMTDGQFRRRYGAYKFSENFIRLVVHPKHSDPGYFGHALYEAMDNAVRKHKARVLVVDGITALANYGHRYADKEGLILQKLKALKTKHNLGLLATAQTRLRPGRRLMHGYGAASRYMAGFADSVFCIGQGSETNLRYLMQLKCSAQAIVHDESNVAVCRIGGRENFPGLVYEGTGAEAVYIAPPANMLDAAIVAMKKVNPDLSLGQIATQLATNKMRVKRVIDRCGA